MVQKLLQNVKNDYKNLKNYSYLFILNIIQI